jgi:hypothetical protein
MSAVFLTAAVEGVQTGTLATQRVHVMYRDEDEGGSWE